MRAGTTRSASRRRRRSIDAGRRAGRATHDPRRDRAPRCPGPRSSHARGPGISTGTDDELAEAVEAARDADVADRRPRRALRPDRRLDDRRVPRPARPRVHGPAAGAARGGRRDRHAGRPRRRQRPAAGARWAAEHCAAILLAWVPGDAGPEAIADVLTGDVNPGGKLPVSMPRTSARCRSPTATTRPAAARTPRATTSMARSTPLWPFGFGLSYTTFALVRPAARPDASSPTAGGEVTIRVDVDEHRRAAGDEVVQLYVRDEEATVARPVCELRGFRRVAPRARRVPDRRLHAVRRAARVHRRGLPPRRRARA